MCWRRSACDGRPASTCSPPSHARRSRARGLWAGSADSSGPDFLAVFDVHEPGNGDRYGALLTTVPVPGRGNGPHHMEHDVAADGRLFANGFRSGQSFIFVGSHLEFQEDGLQARGAHVEVAHDEPRVAHAREQ